MLMLCCEQLFSTSVHIWKEMRSCRIVTLLSARIFHFVLVWFLSIGEIACTRCTCLELWKSVLQFVLYAEPCLSPLGCRVCCCFCFNCPEGPRVWTARAGGQQDCITSSLSRLPCCTEPLAPFYYLGKCFAHSLYLGSSSCWFHSTVYTLCLGSGNTH